MMSAASLSREEPLTYDEWLEIIENRRKSIESHLSTFQLTKLGNMNCLRDYGEYRHILWGDNPAVVDSGGYSLDIQGIFYEQPWKKAQRVPGSGFRAANGTWYNDGTLLIWGLSRKGAWILAEVAFAGEPGFEKQGRERAKTVKIGEINLPDMIAATGEEPENILKKLNRAVMEWEKYREAEFHEVQRLARDAERQEDELKLIPKVSPAAETKAALEAVRADPGDSELEPGDNIAG